MQWRAIFLTVFLFPNTRSPRDILSIDMASAPLKNVAIIGVSTASQHFLPRAWQADHETLTKGSGNLGKHVVNELLHAGFHVTALSRENSPATFPDGVTVKKVDYSSKDALKGALAGQDAVVSTIATLAVGNQPIIADAAYEVGVKRFIPSEFGVNTRKLDVEGLKKMLAFKINLVDDLQKKAAASPAFSWTGISTGLFFDFVRTPSDFVSVVDVHMLTPSVNRASNPATFLSM